jgi:NAD(P)-dependent dehydrogenase (short-subunit alcohol dehydrogenase family)
MPQSSEHAHALQFRCHRITGITANAVCPGWVQTARVEKQIADIAAQKKTSHARCSDGPSGREAPSRIS